jgi:hypothetical protein
MTIIDYLLYSPNIIYYFLQAKQAEKLEEKIQDTQNREKIFSYEIQSREELVDKKTMELMKLKVRAD